jgi:hypothetical protein
MKDSGGDTTRTDTCHTCKKVEGWWRTPYLADRVEAERMGYYSCQPCFDAVWGNPV